MKNQLLKLLINLGIILGLFGVYNDHAYKYNETWTSQSSLGVDKSTDDCPGYIRHLNKEIGVRRSAQQTHYI